MAIFFKIWKILDYCVLVYIYRGVKQTKRNKYKHHVHYIGLSLLHMSYRLVQGLKWEYFTQLKKKGGGPYSASIFETLESFEIEQFVLFSLS